MDDASVAVNVTELLTVNDFSSAIVNVALPVGAVIVTLLKTVEVDDNTVPSTGNVKAVVSVAVNVTGNAPLVVNESAIVKVALEAGSVIVTLLIEVAVATPNAGVTKVGDSAKTNAPVPVSSEITPANSAEVVEDNADNLSDA